MISPACVAVAAGLSSLLLVGCGSGGAVDDGRVTMLEAATPFNASAASLYRNLTLQLIEPTQNEPGCLHFDVYEDADAADGIPKIWQYLIFKDEAAHKAHMEAAHVATWSANTAGLIQESDLEPMTPSVLNDAPVTCLESEREPKDILVVLVKMFTQDASQRQMVQDASKSIIEPTRAEPGCLYYDQLLPNGSGAAAPFVQEVLWFKDAAAHQVHMKSSTIAKFIEATASANVQFNVTKAKSYTTLPACPSGSTVVM